MTISIKRAWHHWTKWECVKAGMYDTSSTLSHDLSMIEYAKFLRDCNRFESAMLRILDEWPISCEQFLSNMFINRIAWMGQASVCIDCGIPRIHRGGFHLLSTDEKMAANRLADRYVKQWEDIYAQKSGGVHSNMGVARLF